MINSFKFEMRKITGNAFKKCYPFNNLRPIVFYVPKLGWNMLVEYFSCSILIFCTNSTGFAQLTLTSRKLMNIHEEYTQG